MKVSVVIPAYNEEKVLATTLKAVLAQNYKDFEVIVVDNASTDNTGAIARQFPVKVVREEKKGLLHARERGRLEATGEIIANIDADCLPSPSWLETGVKVLDSHREAVAVTGPYDYYDAGKMFRFLSLVLQKNFYSVMSVFLQSIGRGAILIGGNNFIRSTTLEKIGGYTTSIIFYGEDTDTARRVAKDGKIIFKRNLTQKTSARRFRSEGVFLIPILYWYHFFRVTFRPIDRTRTKTKIEAL